MFLLGKKIIYNLHFHSQSFYTFVWSECEKQKPFLLTDSDSGTKLLSSSATGERDIFSEFIFGPRFNRRTSNTTGKRQQRTSPSNVVTVLMED